MFIKWLDKKLNKLLYKLHGIDKRGNIPYTRNEMIISGGGNRVIVIDDGKEIIINQLNFKKYLKGVQLLIKGYNNTVIFHLPTKFIDTKLICIGDYNEMVFQKTKHKYDRSILRCFNGSKINIGEDFSVASNLNVCMSKGNLSIGEDCMFSDSIEIFNNDGHKILNKNGELINKPKDIIIKNHV